MLHVDLTSASLQLQHHVSDGTMTEISFAYQEQSHSLHAAACAPIMSCPLCCTLLVCPEPPLRPFTAALSVPSKPDSSTVVKRQTQ